MISLFSIFGIEEFGEHYLISRILGFFVACLFIAGCRSLGRVLFHFKSDFENLQYGILSFSILCFCLGTIGFLTFGSVMSLVLICMALGFFKKIKINLTKSSIIFWLISFGLLLLFLPRILKSPFEASSGDIFGNYLPLLESIRRSGSVFPPYFLREFHPITFYYSGSLYSALLLLGGYSAIPFLSIAFIIMTAGNIFRILQQTVTEKKEAKWVPFAGVAVFYLMIFDHFSRDAAANILKYNHFFSLFLVSYVFGLIYSDPKLKRRLTVFGLALSCGIQCIYFSPIAAPMLIGCVSSFLCFYSDKKMKPFLLSALLFSVAILAPMGVNFYWTHRPYDPEYISVDFIKKFFLKISAQYEEFSNFGTRYIISDYWTNYSTGWSFIKNPQKEILIRFLSVLFVPLHFIIKPYQHKNDLEKILLWISLPVVVWFVLLPQSYYTVRWNILVTPFLAVLLGNFLSDVSNRLYLRPIAIGLFSFLLIPSFLSGMGSSVKFNISWPFKYLSAHVKLVSEYINSPSIAYLRNHSDEVNPLFANALMHYPFSTGTFNIAYFNAPFYALMKSNVKGFMRSANDLGIKYFLFLEGVPFEAPFKPIFLNRDFIVKHFEFIVASEIPTYFEDHDHYYANLASSKQLFPSKRRAIVLKLVQDRPQVLVPDELVKIISNTEVKSFPVDLKDKCEKFYFNPDSLRRFKRVNTMLGVAP